MTSSNRRQFLEQSAILAGSLGCLASSTLVHAAESPAVDAADFQQLHSKLKGQLILPDSAEYENARRVFYWNPVTERKPQAVVQCGHEDDALRAVEFARKHQLEISVRSGGHSHLAWSSSNGLVVDLSPLKQITIDPDKRIARAQGGVFGGELARAAGAFGLAPVLGQCPGVGATGVTLGGGLGWLSGLYGACCDNLLSARLVTANANVIEVTEQSDGDLFWALRGAGANFGVTTSIETRLQPIGSVLGGDVHYATADARTVLHGFHHLMREAPDEYQATLNLTPGERGLFINFCHAGSEQSADQMLHKMRSIAKPMREVVQRQAYADFAQRAPATNPGNARQAISRAIQTVYREQITNEIVDILVDQLAQASPDVVMGLSHYMHGQVCRIAPDATAFPHRKANSVHLRVAFNWSDPAASAQRLAWGQQWLQALRPKSNESLYANYQTYETTAGSSSLFGGNYERLLKLKRKHDPDNFFRRNANIS